MKQVIELKEKFGKVKMGKQNGMKFIQIGERTPVYVSDYVLGIKHISEVLL